ncbi:alpha-galactosidase [Butyrivibrio sp. CB08]|uniref:alpha-galactosidase n=1 Tax=Butyrivibrio sp. CB08 TaxID=2364879 RepID=UPI000EA9F2AC|nr:alpha-galactosidase [Butyrivibrio sp. CB08]RKM61976.1 alpha-galactosidase [Butyrivibrio sp. CB08]
MIYADGKIFLLQTKNTSYMFRVMETGHLEHLHYGGSLISEKKYEKLRSEIDLPQADKEMLEKVATAIAPKHYFVGGNMVSYSEEFNNVAFEMYGLEAPSFGKGDIREPLLEVTYGNGSTTANFLYYDYEVRKGKRALKTLPSSYDDAGECEQLILKLTDKEYAARLDLIYSVFPDCDVITRSAVLYNDNDDALTVDRLLSTCVDLYDTGNKFTSFHGRWAYEMGRSDSVVNGGKAVSEELSAGESGSRSNPFVMVSRPETTDDNGEAYGFNLIYSGNHYEALSSNAASISRFVSGIQPTGFSWKLSKGESFEAPEAVMTFSSEGYNGLSKNMHRFVRKHVVRGSWRDKERPILINSWEANYFNFTQGSLLSLAKEAKKCGIELFVMDDGWFGSRNDDKSSLGDWTENKKKLPGGIKELSEKITDLGMLFGIWVEPEMVNRDSDLYRAHPDWAVQVPGQSHSEGRNQMNLDLTRTEVQDYVIEAMKKVFSAGKVSYVKWDMNRIFSDRFSTSLSADRQGEFQHRYYLGLYRIMKELTDEFPDILFEGCSAGGNRFDLGILCYFPQIWGSDDTDFFCRLDIQRGYSYGYPASTVGAHVSATPNHQTLMNSPLESRFELAAAGCFGYELNLCDMNDTDKKLIKDQVEFYKKYRALFQFGDYYRLPDYGFLIVSEDKHKAVAFAVERNATPSNDYRCIRAAGLNDDTLYIVKNRKVPYSIKDLGTLINAVAPVHIKQDGLVHNLIDKFKDISSEEQVDTLTGAAFKNRGLSLNASFAGTGYNDKTRIMRTGDTRLYIFESI